MALLLRPPAPADEQRVRQIHAAMADEDFAFLQHDGPWDQVLERIAQEARGEHLAPGRVPCDYLVAEVDGRVVGRTSIRHELNDFLLTIGGHVGYGVAPDSRRRGYATEILRQSVQRLAALGVDQVLVTCDDDNIASATVIENCGGVLEDVRPVSDGAPKRRYWIAVDERT